VRCITRYVAFAGGLALAACNGESPVAPRPRTATGPGRAFGIWAPGANDTCPVDAHNAYATVGPDGKLYPTWHPSIDPATGCSFGHDHGRDPSGSDLYRLVGDIPFGYANDQLDIWDPSGQRHEDHVGHKVEWENDVLLNFDSDAAASLFEIRCDILTKLHQGTHSKDAFTNNLHELAYHLRCTDGTELHLTIMAAFGVPGEFERSCDRATIQVGPATPANSPRGGGVRIIPDRFCVERDILVAPGQRSNFGALHESWEASQAIRTAGGRSLAAFNPYFQVRLPSRFHDPATATLVGRPIDVCYEVTPSGERAQGRSCDESTGNGTIPGIAFDDPRSLFDGADRSVDINENRITNAQGPAIWFTNPFGHRAQPDSFPGSIRQFIARIDNDRGDLGTSGPTLRRYYGGARVHAPN
jgi:hypothetical protein